MKPTPQTYDEWQRAFDHFNRELFGGELPPCLITLENDRRQVHGYYSAERFAHCDAETTTDQISLNPYHFRGADPQEPAQTLVHEMCHMWQQHHGDPPRKFYHDKEWAAKMEAVGLMPSNTGAPGGKKTGQRMADYPVNGGPFSIAYSTLRKDGWRPSWYDRKADVDAATAAAAEEAGEDGEGEEAAEESKQGKRVKYTCTGECEANVWGASALAILCGTCNVPFAVAEKGKKQ